MPLPRVNEVQITSADVIAWLREGVIYSRSFFFGLGYRDHNYGQLAEAILDHAQVGRVTDTVANSYGEMVTVVGPLQPGDPTVAIAELESIWILEDGVPPSLASAGGRE